MKPTSRDLPPLRLLATGAAACALLVVTAHAAAAGACGDSVDGKRVPCACGDSVVTDTVLWPTDPIVTEPCSGDGLTLFASSGADSLTLHLGGQSIVGRGYGAGIRVARGGRLGAVIVGGDKDDSRAEIARFGTGIRAFGRDALREVRAIDIHDNTADGLRIHASGVTLDDVRTERNGSNGLALSGHGNRVSDLTARNNARDGLQVHGSAATVSAETTNNGRNGAVISGRGNRVKEIRTQGNRRAGVKATGTGHEVNETQGGKSGAGPAEASE
ncbi:MAG: right-handed parallel beta-helix repeat-containing protein [Candidatus Binatia bacterium]